MDTMAYYLPISQVCCLSLELRPDDHGLDTILSQTSRAIISAANRDGECLLYGKVLHI